MGISDHWEEPKAFSSDCLVTENQKAQQMLQFADFFFEKLRTKFLQFDDHINAFTLSPLNGISSRCFLDHSNKYMYNCLMPSNTFRQIVLNEISSRVQSTSQKIKCNVTVISQRGVAPFYCTRPRVLIVTLKAYGIFVN